MPGPEPAAPRTPTTRRPAPVRRRGIARLASLALLGSILTTACTSAPTPAVSDASEAPPPTPTPVLTPEPSAGASDPAPSTAACELGEAISTDWEPLPEAGGRCSAVVAGQTLTFEAASGWSWASLGYGVALSPDATTTRMTVYGYGGAVVPRYCVDPPPTLDLVTGSAIVEWLASVEGLEALPVGRSVGPYAAWQLDLRVVGAPGCSPGKEGRVALWTIEGQPIELPESLGEGERLRAYLIETPKGILIATVEADVPAYEAFLPAADMLFATLEIE